MTQLKSLD